MAANAAWRHPLVRRFDSPLTLTLLPSGASGVSNGYAFFCSSTSTTVILSSTYISHACFSPSRASSTVEDAAVKAPPCSLLSSSCRSETPGSKPAYRIMVRGSSHFVFTRHFTTWWMKF